MYDYPVSYRDVITDDQRVSAVAFVFRLRDVKHCPILDIGALTDANEVHITPYDDTWPNRAFFAKGDIANYQGLTMHESAWRKARFMFFVTLYCHEQLTLAR